jgi:hypothetical protein
MPNSPHFLVVALNACEIAGMRESRAQALCSHPEIGFKNEFNKQFKY